MQKYKHIEDYRGKKIYIFGSGRRWWWKIEFSVQTKDSEKPFFSLSSALFDAQKYIDQRI